VLKVHIQYKKDNIQINSKKYKIKYK